mmetsp:Transcript_70604/g.207100  ORF Transcript_70604/g.207100 Transcript_70604/m.207100 type:complete len:402 (+) Transcript_70604:194-1399(+)
MDRNRSCDRSCELPWQSSDAGQESYGMLPARTWQVGQLAEAGGGPAHEPYDSDSDPEDQEYEHAAASMERWLVSHEYIEMPESIFGAAMALSFQAYYHSAKKDAFVHLQALVTFAACMLGIAAQWIILYTVRLYLMRPAVMATRELYARYHEDYLDALTGEIDIRKFEACTDEEFKEKICQMPLANPSFCFILLAVWSGFVIIDVYETIRYMYAWGGMKSPKPGRPLAVFDPQRGRFAMKRCSMKLKAVIFLTILLPKLCIAVLCWWVGCRWLIATTSYQEFLLNSVALAFVLDIDEMIYYCSLTRSTQRWVESHCVTLPYAAHHVTSDSVMYRKRRIGFNLVHMTIAWTFMVGAPIMYMSRQQMLPDYEWDVAGPCAKYYSEIFTGLDAMHNLMNMRFGD